MTTSSRRCCPFPKHEGVPWERVVAEDRPYVEWLVGDAGPGMSEELYDHLVVLLMPGWRSAAMRTGKSYRHGEAA